MSILFSRAINYFSHQYSWYIFEVTQKLQIGSSMRLCGWDTANQGAHSFTNLIKSVILKFEEPSRIPSYLYYTALYSVNCSAVRCSCIYAVMSRHLKAPHRSLTSTKKGTALLFNFDLKKLRENSVFDLQSRKLDARHDG